VERGGDKRIAAEPENDAGRVRRADAAEARPGRIEVEARPGELRGSPYADEHAEDRPEQCQPNADLDWIVIIARKPSRVRRCPECCGKEYEKQNKTVEEDHSPVDSEHIGSSCSRHRDADDREHN